MSDCQDLASRTISQKRLTDRQIVVQGNPRVYKALRNQMAEIYEELKHLEKCSEKTRVAEYPEIGRRGHCMD